jgi:hypothetical protein
MAALVILNGKVLEMRQAYNPTTIEIQSTLPHSTMDEGVIEEEIKSEVAARLSSALV